MEDKEASDKDEKSKKEKTFGKDAV